MQQSSSEKKSLSVNHCKVCKAKRFSRWNFQIEKIADVFENIHRDREYFLSIPSILAFGAFTRTSKALLQYCKVLYCLIEIVFLVTAKDSSTTCNTSLKMFSTLLQCAYLALLKSRSRFVPICTSLDLVALEAPSEPLSQSLLQFTEPFVMTGNITQ